MNDCRLGDCLPNAQDPANSSPVFSLVFLAGADLVFFLDFSFPIGSSLHDAQREAEGMDWLLTDG